ncbi:MerR family transcriptional regulator [uncultured Brachyspira sp.]|uniref:helix-turn-helix domain-containing protein n=1 Tax=uncultured Brachyspira sp. TaxID=221953 RepID=UPI00263145A8|nr:MerR family transcriptional regulator [uncultured Brachyspira sp.]
MLNNTSIAYFINNKRYILESIKNKNKNELIAIGNFLEILKNEEINNVTLKNLREWDNKNVLPAYRITHGPIREKVRYYSKEHIDIVREILRLKALGFELPDIKKVIFDNIPECLIFVSKDILKKEEIKKMKGLIENINKKEADIIKAIIKNSKKEFYNNFNIDNLNDDYIKDIINQYKNINLENKEDLNIISFILILISAFNCYDESNNIFDREKFSNYINDIAGRY